MSTGSYEISDGGGRVESEEVRERLDLEGEPRLDIYGIYVVLPAVGASFGAVSSTDGVCGLEIEEIDDEDAWGRRGEIGLDITSGELMFLNRTCRVAVRLGVPGYVST